MGSIKVRAARIAAEAGRPGEWTSDDLEGARLAANELGRPRQSDGRSPDEVWQERSPPTAEQREELRWHCYLALLRELERIGWEEYATDPVLRARINRAAVSTALVKLQYLEIRRE